MVPLLKRTFGSYCEAPGNIWPLCITWTATGWSLMADPAMDGIQRHYDLRTFWFSKDITRRPFHHGHQVSLWVRPVPPDARVLHKPTSEDVMPSLESWLVNGRPMLMLIDSRYCDGCTSPPPASLLVDAFPMPHIIRLQSSLPPFMTKPG